MNNRIKTTITILTVFILSVLSSILFLSFKYKDSCKVDLNIDKNNISSVLTVSDDINSDIKEASLVENESITIKINFLSSLHQIQLIILSVFWLVSKPLTYMKKINPEIIEKYAQELKEDGTNSSYTEIAIINKKAAEDPEVYINMEFLGLDLSKVPTQSLDDYKVYIIPILYVISSIISIKLTTKMSNKNNTKKEKKLLCEANDKDNIKEEKQPDEMEMMQQMNNNMSYMMPIMSVLIAIIAPLGLALYWFISNVLMIIERLIIDKFINQKEEIENE